MLFVLSPSLWFYVEGLTSDKPWKLHIKQLRHYWLLCPALLISVMILFLPIEIHTAIFIEEGDVKDPLSIVLVLSILVMLLLWLVQCTFTLFRIFHRLAAYRQQLKNVFSNNENKELKWMNWFVFIAASTWLFSLVIVFSSNLFESYIFNIRVEAALSLLLIWSLAHFGLLQKPGLIEHDVEVINKEMQSDVKGNNEGNNEENNTSNNKDGKVASQAKKYQRSALGEEQANRIADKINAIMQEDKLYLDANLSLQKLASRVAISPNYISQTLNETLSMNFFDFVNQWRIKAAKAKIIANEDTVLKIALEVGFNARSSFYKAFKQETGKTPSEFRKHESQYEVPQ
jgi:AraC-like DNA-binding protein